jgi:hypothetical protein
MPLWTMKIFAYRFGAFLTIILVCVTHCHAQPDRSERAGSPKQSSKKERDDEAKLKLNEAVSRLSALGSEAQTFEPALRFHVQTQVASLLWNVDTIFARDLFLKALEAAESADRELGEKELDSDAKSSLANYPHDARREVISAAWQKDPVFGEELLARMIKSDNEAQADNENSSFTAQGKKLSRAELERINVATQLLENGDTAQAARIAGDTLNRVVIPSLRFLSELREQNATAADELYVSLLRRLVTDPAADANTVSLLSSYIFSPYVYVTIRSNGSPVIVHNTGPTRPVEVSASIRSLFLNSAAQVLLRPSSDPAAQRISYMIATRLLPLFEQFNPNLATQIRSKLNEISPVIPSNFKTPDVVNNVRKGLINSDGSESLQEMLDQASHLPEGNSRNRVYIRAAISAAESGDNNATKIVHEINNSELRDQVRAYVFMLLAKHALERKDKQKALEFARSDALSPIERVWIYTHAVDVIKTRRAVDVFDEMMEAVPLARRIDASDRNQPRALIGIALQLMRFNSQLAKPYLVEALQAANKADSFDSEDTTLEIRLETPVGDWGNFLDAPDFSLKNLFRELTKADFFQAVDMIDNLKSKEARSVATLAVTETVLSKKNVSLRE